MHNMKGIIDSTALVELRSRYGESTTCLDATKETLSMVNPRTDYAM